MSWKEFIASLVGSLAWPAAAVLVVFFLREQLKSLLGEQVSRLKAGPFEFEWDRTVVRTKKVLPPGIVGEESPGARVVDDLYEIVHTAPSAAVMEGYKRIEAALHRRLNGTTDDVPHLSARKLAVLARDQGLITEETVRAVDGLAVLRNLAAHGGGRHVTAEEAAEYLGLVQAVLFAISSWLKPDDPDAPDR